MITLRPYQDDAHDAVMSDFKAGLHQKTALVLPTGCHAAGQSILMLDGSIKSVEDVKTDDLLIGPDSKPRKVLQLCRGVGKMYEVTPTKGETFVVNEDHVLTLVRTGERANPKYPCEKCAGEYVDVSVKDYLNWSNHKKHIHKLVRTGVSFQHTNVPVDPYLLGMWLGDGNSNGTAITTAEEETVLLCERAAKDYGMYLRKSELKNNKSDTYYIASENRDNPLLKQLEELNVRNNKHIPQVYKANSEWFRLQILAGLIDSDGHLNHNSYDFINKNETLANDVAYVARSLGLAAYVKECRKRCVNTDVWGTYYRVNISGDTDMIPCRLVYKQAEPRKQKKNVLRTSFKVKDLNKEEQYYGFTLDSDHRYLLGDFTITHNSGKTIVTGSILNTVLDGFKHLRGATVVFIAHREELIEQTMEAFGNLGISCSRWTANKKDLSGQVIVAMIQSSRGLPEALEKNNRTVVLLAVDEGHHFAADSYQQRAYSLKSPKTLLITATPIRSDGLDLGIEKISYQISFAALVKAGFLSKPIYHLIRIKGGGRLRSSGSDYKKEDLEKLNNQDRNLIIAQDFQQNRDKYGKTLCFCVNVEHCYNLRSAYELLVPDITTAVVTGDMPKPQRKAVVDMFRAGDIDVLFNVNVFTEGTDVPTINTVQIARPTKSPVMWMQMIGRGSRIDKPSGKDKFLIADYADTENNYAWLADGFATDMLGVPPDEDLEIIRMEQDFIANANDWLKEEGSTKKLKKQLEVLELSGILMMRNKQGKEKRLIVRKQHKLHLDNFMNYFLSNPPVVGTSMKNYVEHYMYKRDPSMWKWPGKFVMYTLGWCMYNYHIAHKSEGKPWAIFKPIPDFNAQ